MGWWSTDIMGGDSPLDFEDEFYDIAGVNKFPESGGMTKLNKESVEKNFDKFVSVVKKCDYEPEVGWQVLAVTAIGAGAKIPVVAMAEMKRACVNDSWAKENDDRKKSVESLLDVLNEYNGTPIIITSKGLFEVINNHISNGNTGLVNK
jgi:hypothetical protein